MSNVTNSLITNFNYTHFEFSSSQINIFLDRFFDYKKATGKNIEILLGRNDFRLTSEDAFFDLVERMGMAGLHPILPITLQNSKDTDFLSDILDFCVSVGFELTVNWEYIYNNTLPEELFHFKPVHIQIPLIFPPKDPKEAASQVLRATHGNPAALRFMEDPTVPLSFVQEFYNSHPILSSFLREELDRFHSQDERIHGVKDSFSIHKNLDVYANARTLFGEIDLFNKTDFLGNLEEQSLEEILTSQNAARHAMITNIHLQQSRFGCRNCQHQPSCLFNGVGAIAKSYPRWEKQATYCLGPKNFPM